MTDQALHDIRKRIDPYLRSFGIKNVEEVHEAIREAGVRLVFTHCPQCGMGMTACRCAG